MLKEWAQVQAQAHIEGPQTGQVWDIPLPQEPPDTTDPPPTHHHNSCTTDHPQPHTIGHHSLQVWALLCTLPQQALLAANGNH